MLHVVSVARGWLTAEPGRSNPSELTWTPAVTSFLWRLIKSCTFSPLSGLLSSWWQHLSRLGRNTSLIKQRRVDSLTPYRISARRGQRVNPYTLSVAQTLSLSSRWTWYLLATRSSVWREIKVFLKYSSLLIIMKYSLYSVFICLFNVMWAILHVSFTHFLNNYFS